MKTLYALIVIFGLAGCATTNSKICETDTNGNEVCCKIGGKIFVSTFTGEADASIIDAGASANVGALDDDVDLRYNFNFKGKVCKLDIKRKPKEE